MKRSRARWSTRSAKENASCRRIAVAWNIATDSFWLACERLPLEIKNRANKQFSLLKDNPRHRSLQFKKVGESRGQDV